MSRYFYIILTTNFCSHLLITCCFVVIRKKNQIITRCFHVITRYTYFIISFHLIAVKMITLRHET